MSQPTDPIQILAQANDMDFVGQVLMYLDGALDAQGVAALSEALRADEAKRDLLVAVACLRQQLRRLESAQTNQPLPLDAAAGEQTNDVDVLLSYLSAEQPGDGYKLAKETGDKPEPGSAVSRPPHADKSAGRKSGDSDVLFSFAGVYVYRKEPSATPSGGIKLKHIAAVAACLLLAAGVAWLALTPAPPPPPPVVATITGQRDATWDQPRPIQLGADLRANDSFSVTSGLLQIQTLRGATVLAEAPSEVQVLGENHLLLKRGKLVARVPDAQAHGFTVDTPTAQLIDLGTEFGVDVNGGSTTRTAVFDGKVILTGPPVQGSGPAPTQLELTAGRTAHASASGQIVEDATPSAELANSFRWFLERQAISDDVVAYWRFEEVPLNQRMAHQSGIDSDRTQIAARDSSENGNHLYAFTEGISPWGSDEVPRTVVPEPRLFNLGSMRNYDSQLQTKCNLYTRGDLQGQRVPLELEQMDRWTIEASVNFADTAGTQSLISKQYLLDPDDATSWLPSAGCVLAVKMRDGRIEVELIDDDGNQHTLTGARQLAANQWHHMAVVFDGRELSLYVRSEGDPQYTHDRLPATLGAVSLTLPEAPLDPASTYHPVEWNVGGLASKEQNARALIDEVRICRDALTPDQFLFASRGSSSVLAGDAR